MANYYLARLTLLESTPKERIKFIKSLRGATGIFTPRKYVPIPKNLLNYATISNFLDEYRKALFEKDIKTLQELKASNPVSFRECKEYHKRTEFDHNRTGFYTGRGARFHYWDTKCFSDEFVPDFSDAPRKRIRDKEGDFYRDRNYSKKRRAWKKKLLLHAKSHPNLVVEIESAYNVSYPVLNTIIKRWPQIKFLVEYLDEGRDERIKDSEIHHHGVIFELANTAGYIEE